MLLFIDALFYVVVPTIADNMRVNCVINPQEVRKCQAFITEHYSDYSCSFRLFYTWRSKK